MTRTRTPRWMPAALALAVLVLPGCEQPTTGPPPADFTPPVATAAPTTSTATTATTPEDPTRQVLAAYERAWDAFATAMRTLDPAGLEAAYAGAALETVRTQVLRQQATGRPVAIDVTRAPRVLSVAGDTAIVEDTYTNASVELDPDTGEPIAPVTPEQVREQRSLQRQPDGTWKVTFITRFEEQGS